MTIPSKYLKIYRDYQYERSKIYYNKEILKKPKPWTTDLILQVNKFTNVVRKHDRESKFLVNTVINSDLSFDDKILNCALFRCFNSGAATSALYEWPIPFSKITDDNLKSHLDMYHRHEVEYRNKIKDTPLQSPAYFLSGVRRNAYKVFPEYIGYTSSLIGYIFKHRKTLLDAYHTSGTGGEVCDKMIKVHAIGGPFMRYQIYWDWTYIPGSRFTENEYVISGPGCDEGIDWMVLGDDKITKVHDSLGGVSNLTNLKYSYHEYPGFKYDEFIYWFRDNIQRLMDDNNIHWDVNEILHYLPSHERVWTLAAIENSFCEFNKYNKLLNKVRVRTRSFSGR